MLIGFSGAGKTSVAREVAAQTRLPRYDTDEMVCDAFRLTIEEIFERHGEEFFRNAETDALRKIPAGPAVIATGGGIVLRDENVRILRKLGTMVWLTADEATLFARVSRDATRPLLRTKDRRQRLAELLTLREPLYRAVADEAIDTTHATSQEVAELIIQKWQWTT